MTEPLIHAHVADGVLHVDAPGGFHAMSGLHALEVPLDHVVGAEVVDHPSDAIQGFRRGMGMALPDEHLGGYHHDEVVDYVAARNTGQGLVVTLRDEKYSRLILSVDDPGALAAALTAGPH